MTTYAAAPWHAASFDRFLLDRLPDLLGRRMPLQSYRVEPDGDHALTVTVGMRSENGAVEAAYSPIPRPDADGVFHYKGRRLVVPPIASSDELESADIRCVGDQLFATFEARLGEAPKELAWDEALLRAWLPLDAWIIELLDRAGQRLDETNWLSAKTHLRRLFLPERSRVFLPGHYGRVCAVETPEGPNIGRVLTVALGATIADGKLEIVDFDPAAGYGLAAHMVPYLGHDEPARLLMGVNMMRQWLTPPDREPALVQTGFEPDDPSFWCGRNLLTAFVSWGIDSFEDAIVVSESAAARLAYPARLEPGDKLSNRHGSKGVVSQILPDAEMPHLEDGTPVDLVFDCMSLFSRMNFGLVREAITGLIAHAEGSPAIVPPFQSPTEADLRARLANSGLPEDGRMQLFTVHPTPALPATHARGDDPTPTLPASGEGVGFPPLAGGLRGVEGSERSEGAFSPHHPITPSSSHPLTLSPLDRRSTAGRVYWGKLDHRAADKIHFAVTPGRCQRQGALEFYALKRSGAVEMIREQFNTRAAEREDATTLAERVAAGPILQADAPSPRFAELARRLGAAGIEAKLEGGGLTFRFAPPRGDALQLARPIAHPWLQGQPLTAIGDFPELPEYRAVVEANTNLARVLASSSGLPRVPERALADLEAAVRALFDSLATPEQLRLARASSSAAGRLPRPAGTCATTRSPCRRRSPGRSSALCSRGGLGRRRSRRARSAHPMPSTRGWRTPGW